MKSNVWTAMLVFSAFLFGLVFVSCAVASVVYAGSRYAGPLIDAHSHVAPRFISSTELVSLFRDAGLDGVFLFGPSAHTLDLQKKNPDFLFPFIHIGRDQRTRRLQLNEKTLRDIEGQLDTGAMRGIGEVSLRHKPFPASPPDGDANPAAGPVMRKIYDLAAERKVPVTVHVEHEYAAELERALEHNRDTIIIWAHLGDAQASLVGEMMRRHRNLYADISARNPIYSRRASKVWKNSITDAAGTLEERWRSVFEEFSDRFLAGLDIGFDRYRQLGDVMDYTRAVLGQLTPTTAGRIAYKNARRLLRQTR
jgi:predicted TIM-barrel fold metal-dependent hydrolase